ncbi:uncharacterized protein F4807DRAFT_465704 [Annulohypoxylon truncatum]|uniref:uncharacterized protein n=1 Tax=Annulohypoxylon truncatum TaxID=327061 RepID=UPI002008DFEB|nr:uncharacterized protein F4807DRAFT_465704 [Annulohypoxylon truncatum]KAI1204469.1 hypothetical protein F4807DRAFT_465704 [Annulohypoxylon truncatum]
MLSDVLILSGTDVVLNRPGLYRFRGVTFDHEICELMLTATTCMTIATIAVGSQAFPRIGPSEIDLTTGSVAGDDTPPGLDDVPATSTSVPPYSKVKLVQAVKTISGEILLNCTDRTGTSSGSDLELIDQVKAVVRIPVAGASGTGNPGRSEKKNYFLQVFDTDTWNNPIAIVG